MVHRRPPWWFSILSLLEQLFNFQKTDLTRICSSTTYWNSGRCKYWCILLKKPFESVSADNIHQYRDNCNPTVTENLFWRLLHHQQRSKSERYNGAGGYDLYSQYNRCRYMPPTIPIGSPTIALVFSRLVLEGKDYGIRPYVVPLNDEQQMC